MNSNPLLVFYPKLHMYSAPVYLLASAVPGNGCSELLFWGKALLVTPGPAGGHRELLEQPRRGVPGEFSFGSCLWMRQADIPRKRCFFFPVSETASVIRRKLIRREITERTLVPVAEQCPVGTLVGSVPTKLLCFASGAGKGWKCSHCCFKYSFISDLSNAGGALSTLS